MSISVSSSPRFAGYTNLPTLASSVQAVNQPAQGRDPNAQDVLLITSTEDFFQDGASRLEGLAQSLKVPMQTLFVEQLVGQSSEEKKAALKTQLQGLRQNGKIDEHTQIIINIHGSVNDAPHKLENNKGDFSVATSELVSTVREALNGATHSPEIGEWPGTIHVGACGIGRAAEDLKDSPGITLLYGGRNSKLSGDSEAVFFEIIRRLGEYRKDPAVNHFPTSQEFYSASGSISGEKIYSVGNGKLFYIASGYLPHTTELAKSEVAQRLQRSLQAKVLHGKAVNVKRAVDLLMATKNYPKFGILFEIAVKFNKKNAEENIDVLLNAGANIDAKDSSGNTALHNACSTRSKDFVSFLLGQYADVNAVNNKGQSVLEVAVQANRLDLVELLIDAGADLHRQNQNGDTVLHQACQKGDERLINLLLQKGALLYLDNLDFISPLASAIDNGHIELALSLMSRADQKIIPQDKIVARLFRKAKLDQFPVVINSLLGLYPDRSQALSAILRVFSSGMGSSLVNLHPPNALERHKAFWSAFIGEMVRSTERMPEYFKKFLLNPRIANTPDYLIHILNVPGFCEKMAVDLQEVREAYRKSGLTKTCEYVDAALAGAGRR